MIKAIIFDCFGVLVTDWLTVLADRYPADIRKDLWDIVRASNLGYIEVSEGTRQMAVLLNLSVDEFLKYRNDNEVKNKKLIEYIKDLRKQGFKIAVLSNVSTGGIDRRFSQQERDSLFDVVAESGSIGFAKPDENAYLYTSGLLELEPSQCLMVDDKDDFCVGAEAVGMSSLVYKDFESFTSDLNLLLADSNS